MQLPIFYSGNGTCTAFTTDRPDCAIKVYAAAQAFFGGDMTWDEFLALTLYGEGHIIYNATGVAPLNLQCVYASAADANCTQLKSLFERAVMRQLHETCGLNQKCTEMELMTFLSGWPYTTENPPRFIFGIEAWYARGSQTPINLDNLTGNSNDYINYLDNAQAMMANTESYNGCKDPNTGNGRACAWGNLTPPNLPSPMPGYYATYVDHLSGYRFPPNDTVYFKVGG